MTLRVIFALVMACLAGTLASCSGDPAPSASLAGDPLEAPLSPTSTELAQGEPIGTPAPMPTSPVPPATAGPTPRPTPSPTPATPTPTPVPRLRTGAEAFADDGFAMLVGKSVGLLANHTSLVDGEPLVDLLLAEPSVDLAALFAPEHGIDGTLAAGERVETLPGEIPVFSLYGQTRQPTPDMLSGIDLFVYDLQDVGTRFYTYISTMGLAMQAAAAADIPFVVLDRANPQGGERVGGFVLEPNQQSFVGLYPIPAMYGMTAGELATAIIGEGWLPGVENLDLRVIKLQNWDRSAPWPEPAASQSEGAQSEGAQSGENWVAPSPGLPTRNGALAYPGTVLFEATSVDVGRGGPEPFAALGAPWVDAERLVADVRGRGLAGVSFEPVTYVASENGLTHHGLRYVVDDPTTFRPVKVGIHVYEAFAAQAPGGRPIIDQPEIFDLLAGTTRLRTLLEAGTPAEAIAEEWRAETEAFSQLRLAYLFYPT